MQNKSLKRDYFFIISCIVITTFTLCITSIIVSFKYKQKMKDQEIITIGRQIEEILSDDFDYIMHLISYLGEKIIENGEDNLEKIKQILSFSLITDEVARSQFAWVMFDWNNVNNKMVVSTTLGILKDPIDISRRSYSKYAPIHPWKLFFDSVDIGISSGEMVIPAGVGIRDQSNKFLGIISLGISVSRLQNKIESILNDSDIRYIVLDENQKIALHSYALDKETLEFFNSASELNIEGSSTNPNIIGDNKFLYKAKMKSYPFTIIAGYSQLGMLQGASATIFSSLIPTILLGLTSLVCLLYLRKIHIQPLIKLSETAKKIKTHNGIAEEVEEPTIFELKILAEQISDLGFYISKMNSMNTELNRSKYDLDEAYKELKKINNHLDQMVKERTEELEEALSIKTRILNNISHETRLPITVMKTYSECLKDSWDQYNEEEKKEAIIGIYKNTNRLHKFITNILDISQYYSGQMIFIKSKGDLLPIVKEVVYEYIQFNLYDHNNIVIIDNNIKKINMEGDFSKLRQAIDNLIGNAIKYSNNGKITIEIKAIDKKFVEFSVKDEGVAIPEEEKDSIFEPFIQSSRTRSEAGGTGLGLPIAKAIIEGHKGGKISVENNEDKGSKFIVTLEVDSIEY